MIRERVEVTPIFEKLVENRFEVVWVCQRRLIDATKQFDESPIKRERNQNTHSVNL